MLAYLGCHSLIYGCLCSSTTHIAEDARPSIGIALLTLCWLSVVAHIQNVVSRVSMLVLHINAADKTKMNHDVPVSILYNQH
jgi:hypothetical protein